MAYHHHLPEVEDRNGLIVMICLFSVLAVTSVVSRFLSRRLSSISFLADDWLSLASLIFVLGLNCIFLAATIQGAMTGHSPVVDYWPVPTPLEHLVQKYKFAFQATEKIAFGLIKLSILFLWKRIFAPVRHFRMFCWVMIGIITAWSFAFFLAAIFQCGIDWQLNWAPVGEFLSRCPNTMNTPPAFAVTDVLTDIVIIGMPIPQIWRLHMSVKRRIGITSVFLVGIFAIAAGVARMYIYMGASYDTEDNPDFIADVTNFLLWSTIEANVALYSSCMPTLPPVGHKIWSMLTGQHQRLRGFKNTWRKTSSAESNDVEFRGTNLLVASVEGTEYERLAAERSGSEGGSAHSSNYTQEDIHDSLDLTALGITFQEHNMEGGLQNGRRTQAATFRQML